MDSEYYRSEDLISLTQGEWQELVTSIQNLVQANNALLQTVSELMAQRNEAFSHQMPPGDPYDLRSLNRLLNEKS